jgi:hypothetical protein
MRSRLAAPLSLAALACGLLTYAETPPRQGALDPMALYEVQVEEGFGRLDVLPSNWTGLPQQRATLSTSSPVSSSR